MLFAPTDAETAASASASLTSPAALQESPELPPQLPGFSPIKSTSPLQPCNDNEAPTSACCSATLQEQPELQPQLPDAEPARSTSPLQPADEGAAAAPAVSIFSISQAGPSQSKISCECVVCWEAEANHIFQPCGHLCTCLSCAQPFLHSQVPCPMCRAPVVSSVTMAAAL